MLGEKNRWFSDTSALDAQTETYLDFTHSWKRAFLFPFSSQTSMHPSSPVHMLLHSVKSF